MTETVTIPHYCCLCRGEGCAHCDEGEIRFTSVEREEGAAVTTIPCPECGAMLLAVRRWFSPPTGSYHVPLLLRLSECDSCGYRRVE